MKRSLVVSSLCGMFILLTAGLVLAAEGAAPAAGMDGATSIKVFCAMASALAIAIAAFGGALSQSKAIVAGLKGIARNPAAAGKLTTTMIIGLALIESLVIYALVVSLILVFKV
jgi:F-type H+-transporting ATPase subunit c